MMERIDSNVVEETRRTPPGKWLGWAWILVVSVALAFWFIPNISADYRSALETVISVGLLVAVAWGELDFVVQLRRSDQRTRSRRLRSACLAAASVAFLGPIAVSQLITGLELTEWSFYLTFLVAGLVLLPFAWIPAKKRDERPADIASAPPEHAELSLH